MRLQLPSGPDPHAIRTSITRTYPDAAVAALDDVAWFFSLDPVKHFPNFATLVTVDDDYDRFSDLSRPGVFRLSIGVLRPTFDRLVGDIPDPDYTALDTVFPHPVYAGQRYVSILNPSHETFESVVKPLIAEAYGILARRRR